MSSEELDKQLERIGADGYLRGGFSVRGRGVTGEDVALALRTTPDGAGTPGFEKRLQEVIAARRAKGEGSDAAGA
jgi:hypothetical protein